MPRDAQESNIHPVRAHVPRLAAMYIRQSETHLIIRSIRGLARCCTYSMLHKRPVYPNEHVRQAFIEQVVLYTVEYDFLTPLNVMS